ncbi:MAG TPA: response regulator [Candidatus Binatia bacterium]|nr:response regulator [Candidatus Binatia bacterium]
MKALVVDDSRAMRAILGRMLREAGYDVAEASNGREALEVFRASGAPSLLLVDWNMPEMNGLDLVRAVRGELGERDVSIMMVTTEIETAQVVRALAAGANEYLMKPFTREGLLEKLRILGAVAG